MDIIINRTNRGKLNLVDKGNIISFDKRNYSIDMSRIIFAIMVVAVHTNPLYDISETLGYIATNIIPMIGVLFFFSVSGFYYTRSLLSGKRIFKKTFISVLKVYITWSFVYFFVDLINVFLQGKLLVPFIKSFTLNFFIHGSHYHLWFFPAILFCFLIVAFFHRIRLINVLGYASIFLFVLGLLGSSYYSVGNSIPLIKLIINKSYFPFIRRVLSMGFPFFMLGYFLNVFKYKYQEISNKNLLINWFFVSILFLIEIILVIKSKLQVNIAITIFSYPLLFITMIILLKNPLSNKKDIAKYLKKLSSFMYYSHPLFLTLLSAFQKNTFIFRLSETPTFLITIILTTVSGTILMKSNNKWIKKLI